MKNFLDTPLKLILIGPMFLKQDTGLEPILVSFLIYFYMNFIYRRSINENSSIA